MKNDLEVRTKQFALTVIQLVGSLPRTKAADVIGYQILKSDTIGANWREAQRGQSHNDFIHKLAICEKEAAETGYWIELLIESKLAGDDQAQHLFNECSELLAIFVTSGKTAKSRR